MADVALRGDIGATMETPSRAKVLGRLRLGDMAFRQLTRAAAVTVLLILGGVIGALIIGAVPALQAFGFGFLIDQSWNPVTERFGALAPIYGTVVTSFIAMLIAVPVGLLIAIFLTDCVRNGCAGRSELRSSCSPASPASSMEFGGCSYSRRSCRTRCSRS